MPFRNLMIAFLVVLGMIFLPLLLQSHIDSDVALVQALAYLEHEFSPEIGLIRESPDQVQDSDTTPYWRYWLTTDNWVAQHALDVAGADTLAASLADTLHRYGDQKHGIIEILAGEDIELPPRTEVQSSIAILEEGNVQVWYEQRTGPLVMHDWEEYADLLLYGALDAFYTGEGLAVARYHQAMAMFDGTGFKDRYFQENHLHPTYKLALALYTAHVIGQPERRDVLTSLLSQQDSSGGFYTLYDEAGHSVGNTSTEPTAHAVLALSVRH